LDKQEASSIYTSLLLYLKSNKLDWIAKQVEEEIALGHIETKKLDVQNKDLYDISENFKNKDSYDMNEVFYYDSSANKTKKSKAVFVVSTPYNEREKLKLLIDSIEIGVARLSEIVNTTLEFIQNEIQQSQIMFEPEADVKEPFEITTEQAKLAYENSRKLIPLLDELRKEI
jgi:hypothetical protein